MDTKKYEYQDYTQSERVNQARTALDQNAAMKPGDYQSQWQGQIDAVLGQIQNRQPFQYDINQDALYNQYKDQYIRGGRLAMMDTMGQAAALTGGYGSTYAQQVGQQAFQGYLQGLNDKVPQLYQAALDQYNRQGDDLYKQYALLGERESQDYGRYQDAMNLWLNDRAYLNQVLGDERSFDYGAWKNNRDFGYQDYRDQIADEQWQKQFDEQVRQFDILHPQNAAGGGGGGGGGKNPAASSADLQFIAKEAEAAKKAGASKKDIKEYIYKSVSKIVPSGSSSTADRIAYEMARAQGVVAPSIGTPFGKK